MDEEKIVIASKTIELSEYKTYIELTNRLCYYDVPNRNGVMLLSDTAEEKAKTLIDMPVVAKFRKDAFGRPDLGGHEMYKDPVTKEIKFGTENIGTHVSVEIKDDEVEIDGEKKTVSCLYAKSKVWTRNKNVVAAIKRLFSEGKLHSSWEILISAFTFENGIKTITDYVFESNALLGSTSEPAYWGAGTLEISEAQNCEMLIAAALANDINIKLQEQEDSNLAKEKELEASVNVGTEETGTPVVTENSDSATVENKGAEPTMTPENGSNGELEVSALTEWDLRKAIQKACQEKINKWCWIFYHFPVEKTVWVEYDGRASEIDYMVFTYEVNGDVVTVSDPQEGHFVVSIPEINNVVSTKDLEISQKNETLIKANEKIIELKSEVANLTPFKESCEKAERERIEAEIAEKKKELSAKMVKSKLFTTEELESSEIKALIDNADETAIKNMMADRLMASLVDDDTGDANIKTDIETSEVVGTSVKANIDSDYSELSLSELMEMYSKRNKERG